MSSYHYKNNTTQHTGFGLTVNMERSGGAVYIRWGRTECPATAEVVYAGFVGVPGYEDVEGAATTYACHSTRTTSHRVAFKAEEALSRLWSIGQSLISSSQLLITTFRV